MTEREYQEVQTRLRAMRGERQPSISTRSLVFGHPARSRQDPLSKWWYFAAGLGLGLVVALGAGAEAAPLARESANGIQHQSQERLAVSAVRSLVLSESVTLR